MRPAQGATAPWERVLVGSGTTRSGTTVSREPSPSHRGHAPWGELNENERGLSSGSETPQSGQANRSENQYRSDGPCRGRVSTTATPSARARASSRASANRLRAPGFTTIRSTTTSRVWLRFFSRTISSSRSRSSPSTRTRRNPAFRRSSNRARCSPFRPRTTGDSTSTRVPSPSASTRSTIWVTVWLATSRPQDGQWGTPTRA